jgi:hypothetical protein
MPVDIHEYSNGERVMALSEAAVKRNKEANKRAKTKNKFYPSAGPSAEEIKSMKNKKAAIASAGIEMDFELDKLGKDLERAKTVRGKDIIIAKFMKKAEAQKEMNKISRDENQKQKDKAARDAIATTAGIKKYAKGGGIRKANYK